MDKYTISEEAYKRGFEQGVKEAIRKMREFLALQSKTVESMTILSGRCIECYLGSQGNRLKALKDIAKELGVEEDGKE